MTDLRLELRLPWEELTWSGPPEGIIKNTTADIEPQEEIIGQDRAVKALRRGLAMPPVLSQNLVYDNGDVQLYHRRALTPYQR